MNIDERLDQISDCLYRVSLKAVVVHDHKLLLTQETGGWFGLPGGGLDFDENIETCLRRELHEEIGVPSSAITIDATRPLLVTSGAVVNRIPFFNVYYKVEILQGAITNSELSHLWADKKELAELKIESVIVLAKDFLLELL